MAVASAPAASRPAGRLLGACRAAAVTAARAAGRAIAPHRASLARLADIPLSLAGTAGIDFAAFHVSHGVGWLVLGASLWVIEHMIADDGPGGGTA